MANRRCAMSPLFSEFSLCGDACDGFDSGDLPEPFDFVEDGQSITCLRCCLIIREVKAMRNTLRPLKEKEYD